MLRPRRVQHDKQMKSWINQPETDVPDRALAAQEGVVPIPGTKRRKNLEENVAALGITLTSEDLKRIDEAAPKGVASGERYEDMTAVNL